MRALSGSENHSEASYEKKYFYFFTIRGDPQDSGNQLFTDALKTTPPRSVTIKIFPGKFFFYDIQVCVVEMSQLYQKTVLFDQKRFFRYFRAPKPPQANPKIPIPY